MPIHHVEKFSIEGPVLVHLAAAGDERGWVREAWNHRDWLAAGLPDIGWVQENHAFAAAPGTTRGLHFQSPPHGQAKLFQVLKGEIFVAFIDLRDGSATYGKSAHVSLKAGDHKLLFVPVGFAHGYQTLSTNTLVSYKMSDHPAPECQGGLLWTDVGLNIPWPRPDDVVMSGRDFTWPRLADLKPPFALEP